VWGWHLLHKDPRYLYQRLNIDHFRQLLNFLHAFLQRFTHVFIGSQDRLHIDQYMRHLHNLLHYYHFLYVVDDLDDVIARHKLFTEN